MLRNRIGLGVLALWAAVSLARLTRLFEAPEAPPGQEVAPLLALLRTEIPPDAGYLFVLPGEFGADSGLGPRLRYELYPRTYDDVRASLDEGTVRALMRGEQLRYIVVADASQYPAGHWLRGAPAWLRRVDFGADQYVLEVMS
jgi:hypothetical protein